MTSKSHYLKLLGSIALLAGLTFIALHRDNVVNDNKFISKVEVLENTSTPVKETQFVADKKNLDNTNPEISNTRSFQSLFVMKMN